MQISLPTDPALRAGDPRGSGHVALADLWDGIESSPVPAMMIQIAGAGSLEVTRLNAGAMRLLSCTDNPEAASERFTEHLTESDRHMLKLAVRGKLKLADMPVFRQSDGKAMLSLSTIVAHARGSKAQALVLARSSFPRPCKDPPPIAQYEVRGRAAANTCEGFESPIPVEGCVSVMATVHAARDQLRGSIGRDLHDTVGQELTMLRLTVRRLWHRLKTQAMLPDGIQDEMQAITQQLDTLMGTTRRLAFDLGTMGLDEAGFSATVADLVNSLQRRLSLPGNVEIDSNWRDPDEKVRSHLYRIVQELLHNITKHACASRFWVRLLMLNGDYCLEVRDDGVGLPAEVLKGQNGAGMGMRNIRQRASLCGGSLKLASRPDVPGTLIQVRIPAVFESLA